MSTTYEAFGKYILLEKLAMGGMAEVYLARNTGADGIGKFIAIKRILPQFSEDPAFVDMFKDEAKIAVNLAHSNIVSIHEFGIEKNQFFLVMDYVEGRDLRRILNKMKKSGLSLSAEQVLYIIKEVAAGLDSAHRCLDRSSGKPLNINHRDISPQNVMISFEGEVKIVDFGIAKAETQIETTRAGTLKGKFGYMSPEQAEGQTVDLRTDIFSLGIVLWELLANDRLFVANNEVNILRKIRECQIPSLRKINPNIPTELERICNKALARDRNLRYQTAAAFHRDLSRFLNRQYPDFSPHDFSVFIKTLFATEILEHRKKIVEFSKSDGRHSNSAKASVTAPLDESAPPTPEPRVAVKPPPAQAEAKLEADPQTTHNTDIELTNNSTTGSESALFENIDFATPDPAEKSHQIKSKVAEKSAFEAGASDEPRSKASVPPSPNATKVEKPAATAAQAPKKPKVENDFVDLQVDRSRRPRTDEGTSSGYSYRNTGTYTRIRERNRVGEVIQQSAMATAALGVIAVLGLYAHNPNKFKTQLNEYLQKSGVVEQQRDLQSQKPEAPAQTNRVKVSITSTPPSAEVWLNDTLLKDVTPMLIDVDAGVEQNISVRKTGFKTFQQRVKFDNDGRIVAQLVRDKVAFIDIIVEGTGEIFVNDKKVAVTGPVLGYAIPADEDIIIKAIDPRTNASDQTSPFKLGEGFSKQVRLQPKIQPPTTYRK